MVMAMPNELKDGEQPADAGVPKRRRYPRHELTRFVWYKTIDTGDERSREGVSFILDIARGGMGMVAKEDLPIGTLLLVKIVFDRENYHLAAVCRVAYTQETKEGNYNTGLEFVALPPDGRQFLTDNFD